ncbi:hypothetical protein SUGI_0621330 [Cryptomeria japonica]|nr:hypothetical protein SUGI_0621330 [Cryptomeria japonica]
MGRAWNLVFFLLVWIQSVVGYQFVVGGSKGWTLPSPSDKESYNQWAGRNRFQIGDTLLFKYENTVDSVAQVRQESYNECNTSDPIASYTDGNTVFKFPINGPFYFISGNQSRCQLEEKLIVVVLAPCHMGKGKNCKPNSAPSPSSPLPTPSPSLSPSPLAFNGGDFRRSTLTSSSYSRVTYSE